METRASGKARLIKPLSRSSHSLGEKRSGPKVTVEHALVCNLCLENVTRELDLFNLSHFVEKLNQNNQNTFGTGNWQPLLSLYVGTVWVIKCF